MKKSVLLVIAAAALIPLAGCSSSSPSGAAGSVVNSDAPRSIAPSDIAAMSSAAAAASSQAAEAAESPTPITPTTATVPSGASADPGADEKLTNLLYSGAFSKEYYISPMSDWISIAHTSCEKISDGLATASDIRAILEEELSPDAARFYMAAVITLYCPDQSAA